MLLRLLLLRMPESLRLLTDRQTLSWSSFGDGTSNWAAVFASTTSSLGFTSYITMHTGHEILQNWDPELVLTQLLLLKHMLFLPVPVMFTTSWTLSKIFYFYQISSTDQIYFTDKSRKLEKSKLI
jgi:hypothetical protein